MSSLIVNKGSDAEFILAYKDAAGEPIDLTGRTVLVFDEVIVGATSRRGVQVVGIKDKITGTVTNGAGGIVTLKLDGTDPIPVGKYSFRVQLNEGTGNDIESLATPLIYLDIR